MLDINDPKIRRKLERTGLMHLANDPAALEAEIDRQLNEYQKKEEEYDRWHRATYPQMYEKPE